MNSRQALTLYPKSFLQYLLENDLGVDFLSNLDLRGVTRPGLNNDTTGGSKIVPLFAIFRNTYNSANPSYDVNEITRFLRLAFEPLDFSSLRPATLRYFCELSNATIAVLFNTRMAADLINYKDGEIGRELGGLLIPIPQQILTFIEGLYIRSSVLNVSRKINILAKRIDVLNAIHGNSLNEMSSPLRDAFVGRDIDLIPAGITNSTRIFRTGEGVISTPNSASTGNTFWDTFDPERRQIPTPRPNQFIPTFEEPEEPVPVPETPQYRKHSILSEGYSESKLNQKLQGCYVLFNGDPVFIHEIRGRDIVFSTVNGTRLSDSVRQPFSDEFDITQPILGFINTDVGVYFIERRHVDNNASKYKIAFCTNKVRRHAIHPIPSFDGLRKVFRDRVMQHLDISESYMVSKLLVKQYYTVSEAVESIMSGKRMACAITEDLALAASYENNSIYVWLGTKVVGYYDGTDAKLHIKARSISQFFVGLEEGVVYE